MHPQTLLLRVLPMLLLGLVISCTGEMSGYAVDPGKAQQRLSFVELHRSRRVDGRKRYTRIDR
jgi:hypothetical protein